MLRFLLVAFLALVALPAAAQTSVTRNCVTLTCSVVGDVTTVADGCRLYDGAAQIAQVARSGASCPFPARNFAAGVHVLTMTAYNADGESAASPAVTLTSRVPTPPPAPTNLRILP